MTKTYVLTGATSGIGNLLLKNLPKGNKVFAGYRNENLLSELNIKDIEVIPFYIDLSDFESVKDAAEYIKSKTDKIDTLFNVAGCVVAGAIEQIPQENLKKQFYVNTFSPLGFSQLLFDRLEGGRIINVSSMASFGLFPFVAPYCASKRALDMLFNSILLETKHNIKIISIKPGVIATPLWEKSVKENTSNISSDKNFESENKMLVQNAMNNSTKGLNPQKVVDIILKADSSKNPKLSYLVGKDAIIASLFAKLPQRVLNSLIRMKLKNKMLKY